MTHLAQDRLIITYPNTFEATLREGVVQATPKYTYMGYACALEDVIAGYSTDKQVSLKDLREKAVVRASKTCAVDLHGNIFLGDNGGQVFVISCAIIYPEASGYACVPFMYGNNWYAHVINILDGDASGHLPPPTGTQFMVAWAYTLL